jgi:hypothetical protein
MPIVNRSPSSFPFGLLKKIDFKGLTMLAEVSRSAALHWQLRVKSETLVGRLSILAQHTPAHFDEGDEAQWLICTNATLQQLVRFLISTGGQLVR